MEIKKYVFENIKKLTNKKFDEQSEVKNIGIDSLDLLEMITEVESDLGISISDDDLSNIKTVKDVIEVISNTKK